MPEPPVLTLGFTPVFEVAVINNRCSVVGFHGSLKEGFPSMIQPALLSDFR